MSSGRLNSYDDERRHGSAIARTDRDVSEFPPKTQPLAEYSCDDKSNAIRHPPDGSHVISVSCSCQPSRNFLHPVIYNVMALNSPGSTLREATAYACAQKVEQVDSGGEIQTFFRSFNLHNALGLGQSLRQIP